LVAHKYQPAKVAALEGWWVTRTQQPTVLIGFPNEAAERNELALELPGLGSAVNDIAPNETVRGLDAFKPQDRPPVFITFWAFRIMVGMGLVMAALGFWGAVLWILKRLDGARWFQRAAVLAAPSGFIAVISGWTLAEVGRQPYVVYGVLRTADAVAPVEAGQVAFSLLAFIVTYAIVFTAGAIYILRLMHKGPDSDEPAPTQIEPPGSTLGAAVREA
jgi:cytochrome d ubiquinol oxidase subunit I